MLPRAEGRRCFVTFKLMADNMMASVPLAFSEGGDRCKFAISCDAIREIPKESSERLEAADRWFLWLLETSQRGRCRVCGSEEEVTVLRVGPAGRASLG